MKKKIVSLILVISIFATFLSGCSILKLNTFRDGARPVASISFGGLQAVVTKTELAEYFAANGGTYIQYYGMTPEQVLDLFKESLANAKLNVLNARIEVSKQQKKDIGASLFDLLTKAEQKKAIDDTNKIFEDAFTELVKEVQKEKDLLNKVPEDEEEEEDKEDEDTHTHDSRLTPRATKTKVDPEFNPDEVIEGDLPVSYLITIEAKDKTEIEVEALRRLNKNLKDSKRGYDYYLEKQHESLIVSHYKRTCVEKDVTVTDSEIQVRYNEIFAKNKATYGKDKEAYYTAIKTAGAGNNVIQNDGYVFVKQILIKFSDAQTKEIEEFGKDINNEAALNEFRMNMVKNIKTSVSNTEYDAEKDCIGFIVDENGKITETKYDVAVDKHPVDHKCSADGKDDRKLCPRYPFTERDVTYNNILDRILTDVNAAASLKDKVEAFDKWVYLANDDTGMFNNAAGYCITPEGEKSEYVDSFTELGRELGKMAIGSCAIDNAKIDATKFTLQNYTSDKGTVTMAISTFGIHIMMSTQIPSNGSADTTEEFEGVTRIKLNYIVDPINNKTLSDILKETILKEKKADATSYKNIQIVAGNKDTAIVYNDKLYKSIVKQMNKLYNA